MRRFPTASDPAAFCAGLRTRRDAGRPMPVGQVVLRPRRSVHPHVRLSVRLALQVMQRYAIAAVGTPGIVLAAASPAAPAMPGERFVTATLLAQTATRVLRERLTRVFAAVAHAPTLVAPAAEAPPRMAMLERIEREVHYPRVALVVKGAAPSAAVRAEAAARARAAIEPPSAASRAPSPPFAIAGAAQALPAAELTRVTDHVIRQLDRRVLSYRERMGRI